MARRKEAIPGANCLEESKTDSENAKMVLIRTAAQEVLEELGLEGGMSVGCCFDFQTSPPLFFLKARKDCTQQCVSSRRFSLTVDIKTFKAEATTFLRDCDQGFLGLSKVVPYARGLAAQSGKQRFY